LATGKSFIRNFLASDDYPRPAYGQSINHEKHGIHEDYFMGFARFAGQASRPVIIIYGFARAVAVGYYFNILG
jgi:hypothetical protein